MNRLNRFDKMILNILKLLVERHRINQIAAIVDHYHDFTTKQMKSPCDGYSVRALTDEEKTSLENAFKKRFNKK